MCYNAEERIIEAFQPMAGPRRAPTGGVGRFFALRHSMRWFVVGGQESGDLAGARARDSKRLPSAPAADRCFVRLAASNRATDAISPLISGASAATNISDAEVDGVTDAMFRYRRFRSTWQNSA